MLQESWVDALFERLTLRYGVAFMRQWEDMAPAAVKLDWACVLHGIDGQTIKRALQSLPSDKPPNASQFRRLCMDAIPGEAYRVHVALPAPKVPQPESVRARLDTLRNRQKESS